MTMSRSDDRGLKNGSNDGDSTASDHRQAQYQFGGDYVISSSAAPGAWISATYPANLGGAR